MCVGVEVIRASVQFERIHLAPKPQAFFASTISRDGESSCIQRMAPWLYLVLSVSLRRGEALRVLGILLFKPRFLLECRRVP